MSDCPETVSSLPPAPTILNPGAGLTSRLSLSAMSEGRILQVASMSNMMVSLMVLPVHALLNHFESAAQCHKF